MPFMALNDATAQAFALQSYSAHRDAVAARFTFPAAVELLGLLRRQRRGEQDRDLRVLLDVGHGGREQAGKQGD